MDLDDLAAVVAIALTTGDLEVVENTRRAVALGQRAPTQRVHHGAKRFCVRGHEFTDANTYRDRHGRRFCRACRSFHAHRYRQSSYVPAAARDDRTSRAAMKAQ